MRKSENVPSGSEIARVYERYCRSFSPNLEPGRESANRFDRWARERWNPTHEELSRWRSTLRRHLSELDGGWSGSDWRNVARDKMRLRQLSLRTEKSYLGWLDRLASFCGEKRMMELNDEDVVRFLTHLAVEKRVAVGTQNQAFHAVLFYFRSVLGEQCFSGNGSFPALYGTKTACNNGFSELESSFSRLQACYWTELFDNTPDIRQRELFQ